MAKHCNVCNRDYADNLAACPHCAAAKKTQLASQSEERKTQLGTRDDERVTQLEPSPSDSVVNLGSSPDLPAEGDSAIVVEEAADSKDKPVELVSDDSSTIDEGPSPLASVLRGAKPEQPPPSESEVALEALMSDDTPTPSSGKAAAEEQAVSEEEAEDVLASLEETPEATAPQEPDEIVEGEEPISAAEAEEAAEAAEAEEEKPAKAVKPRPSIPALAGATVLGILLGVVGTLGTKAMMGSGEKEKQPGPVSLPQSAPPSLAGAPQAKAAPTFETLAARVASGDLDEAKAAGIEELQAANAKQLVAVGEYRLLTYLKSAGTQFNPKDPAFEKAIQDLQKAADQKEPDALYNLGFIKELAGQLDEARAEYAKGAQTVANDPVQKQRFESAVLRVELKAAAKAAAGAAKLPQGGGLEDRAAMLALLGIALQQAPAPVPQLPQQAAPPQRQPGQPGQPGQQPAAADNKEAGFDFWEAVKQAHAGKFTEAIAALDRAKKLHDKMRFTRLRKAQNPLSDPAEDIFLSCCDELKTYWQLEKELREGGYLTDKNTPWQAIQALVKKAQQGGGAGKELTDKLTAAQKAQKNAEDKAAGLEKQIQSSKAEIAKLTNDLKARIDELQAAKKAKEEIKADLTSAKQQLEKLKSDSGTESGSLKKIREELIAANFLKANDKTSVSEAVKKAIHIARTNDPQGMLRRQSEEIGQLSAALRERWQPEEMLPLWLLLLDENRGRTELAGRAVRDAQRVLADPQATAAQRGEAEVVMGLALRNTEKFREAKTMLEAARRTVNRAESLAYADSALKEVANPAAYLASQAQLWYDHGRMEAALDELARGLKILPAKDHGKLLAQRSLIELDAARAKVRGSLPPTEPLLIAAQKDADAAVKAGAAEGHYAAGRIAEALGRVDVAIASYRAALAAHGRLDAEGSRYRMALARALLLPREARPAVPALPPPKAAQRVGWRDPAPYPGKHFEDKKALVLMLTLGLQPPLLPGEEPGLDEAEKLADEVLKAPPGTVPFDVLAQALAVKGRWSLALQVYVEGIRPMLPREYYDGLMYLILNDPRLKRPDSLRIPNPLEAEKHFAAGLNFYFDGDYLNAEKSFLLTIENDSQDARFFYFLGLSRLALNRRRDAYADFNQGAMLEHLNRPAPAAVDESLERIQGPTRCILNEFRQSPER
jgi:hypothetical protein